MAAAFGTGQPDPSNTTVSFGKLVGVRILLMIARISHNTPSGMLPAAVRLCARATSGIHLSQNPNSSRPRCSPTSIPQEGFGLQQLGARGGAGELSATSF